MKDAREWRQENRQTELQRVFDMATENRQNAIDEIARMYEKVKELRVVIQSSELTIELCKERAIEQGVLNIL